MGLIIGQWSFAHIDRVPSIEAVASELARATGLQVIHPTGDNSIEIPILGEVLVDIAQTGNAIIFCSGIPAHPYLWENLDRIMENLGGQSTLHPTRWRSDQKFRHLRQPWANLAAQQRFLLRFPTIGASRFFDRFV